MYHGIISKSYNNAQYKVEVHEILTANAILAKNYVYYSWQKGI